MLSVAVTGNVASGKSAVSSVWADAGVPVVSADELARRATEPGSEGLEALVEAFGRGVLRPDGSLDREELRGVVFEDGEARRRLEELLHPRIRALRAEWLEERRREGAELVVSEIPLLFETGMEDEFDLVVLVDAPAELRLRRMVEERELDPGEARRIIDAQMPADEKRERSQVVIENDGTLQDLRAEAVAILDLLRARARASEGE